MPTYESEITREARRVARLQIRRRNLRAQLKATEAELRTAKRQLRAIIGARDTAGDDWHASGAASKVFGVKAGE